jgi:hypothetical protein
MKTLKVIIGIICMLVVCSICQAQELSKRKSVIIGEPLKESDFSQPSTVQHSGGLSGEITFWMRAPNSCPMRWIFSDFSAGERSL